MKIIHCADMHLDAAMTANLGKEQAAVRRAELLRTFERMVEYADEEGVQTILIAGDLFDSGRITATTKNAVLRCLEKYPEIHFYYLQGNHDREHFPEETEQIPENLRLFGSEWTYYSEGSVRIAGVELTDKNGYYASLSYTPSHEGFQIVMLHGQQMESGAQSTEDGIPLREFRGKDIDYLALGHVHAYQTGKLDARTVWCYPGCLEGRGFDECGEHGFVLLDIDEETGRYTHTFIPFAARKLYEISADVTGCMSSAEICDCILRTAADAGCEKESLVKVILTGVLDVNSELSMEYLLAEMNSRFFYAKISNETTFTIQEADYRYDVSLKGEFVRTVLADSELSEEEKQIVIRYGLQAFTKEGID